MVTYGIQLGVVFELVVFFLGVGVSVQNNDNIHGDVWYSVGGGISVSGVLPWRWCLSSEQRQHP